MKITSEAVELPTRTLLYGVDGIGKTTWGAKADKPIFICTEEGATRMTVPKFPLCKTWDDVLVALRLLYKEDHKYKTVVIDSVDWAQTLAVAHVIERDYDLKSFEAYGKGYKTLMIEWINFLNALDHLRHKRGMDVILIAHAVVRTFKNPLGDDYDRYESNLHNASNTSIWAKTKEWCDIVLFANYSIVVKKDDKKATKGKGIMNTTEARVCHSCPSAAWDAKVRAGWSLPDEMPLDYAVYAQHINGTKPKTTTKKKETSDAV